MDDVAVLIREDLHFDVPRVDDGLLQIDFTIAESASSLALCRFQGWLQFLGGVNETHALATTAGRRFQHYGIADLPGRLLRLLIGFDSSRSPGHQRDPSSLHFTASTGF